jgi:hypothetical protein
MSNIQARHDSALLRVSVDMLIHEHGRVRVALAALAAALRKRRREPQSAQLLDNRLRADIGLPPIVDPPGLHWNVRW